MKSDLSSSSLEKSSNTIAEARSLAADLQYVPGFLSAAEVTAMLAARTRQQQAIVNLTGLHDDPGAVVRRATVTPIDLNAIPGLAARLHSTITALNASSWQLDLKEVAVDCEISEYGLREEGPGLYAPHLDLTDTRCAPDVRKVSWTCGLSDEHAGGDLVVHNGPVAYRVKVMPGDLVAFPSYLLQEVAAVGRGVRITLDGWLDGPPLR